MNRNYIFLTILMLVLAAGTLLIKKTDKPKQIEPQQLLSELIQPTRFVNTDEIAKMIIQKDPSLELIDVRGENEFNSFSLPNAINVPIDSILSPGGIEYLGIPGIKVVFISNDDIKADQAWILAKRHNFESIYVMKGGINGWMKTIIQPQEPSEDAPFTEFETYEFRKGARMYFTGVKTESTETQKIKVNVKRKKKSTAASGGC